MHFFEDNRFFKLKLLFLYIQMKVRIIITLVLDIKMIVNYIYLKSNILK